MPGQRSTKWAIRETYVKPDVAYECPEVRQAVKLDCFYTLEVTQGSEGFLDVCCSSVRCSHAADCPALRGGACPLEHPKAEVLNEMRINVMQGERGLLLEDDGSVFEVGEPRLHGQVIWFGVTKVTA